MNNLKLPKSKLDLIGLHEGIENDNYHEAPKYSGMSSSLVKKMLISPAHYQAALHLGGKPSKAKDFGTAYHSHVLEPEKKRVVAMKKVDGRTKEGRQYKAEFLAANADRDIVSEDEFSKLQSMHGAIQSNEMASMLLSKGRAEVSGFFRHPDHGFFCKIRPDFLIDDLQICVDFKTAIDASPEGFSRAAFKYGYHISAYWYIMGLKVLTGKDYTFVWVAQEKEPPYAIGIYSAGKLKERTLTLGRLSVEDASKRYAECLESNTWPAYSQDIESLTLPAWASKRK